MEPKKLCTRCARPLVPIRHARVNGADHPDWSGRTLHKRCCAELVEEGHAPVRNCPNDVFAYLYPCTRCSVFRAHGAFK